MNSDNLVAVANFGVDSKMSTPERIFYNGDYLLLRDFVSDGVEIKVIQYESISLNIPGGKYTPDFFVIFSDGSIAFVEVKQESITKSGKKFYGHSYRDSRAKLRAAAEMFPWFKFFQASYNTRTGWKIEPIVPKGYEYDR